MTTLQRDKTGIQDFCTQVETAAGITRDQSVKIANFYREIRVLRVEPGKQGYEVSDQRYMAPDVLRETLRAIEVQYGR